MILTSFFDFVPSGRWLGAEELRQITGICVNTTSLDGGARDYGLEREGRWALGPCARGS
jgi:hypothetical protein